ncbi:MAG TPA: hypothetical protein VK553_02545 [Candidatus Nitrosopolaris rasttigaisensis]|nr:hypothetical protein [Candidatus Nitrosopolaris rasttigaisensis]
MYWKSGKQQVGVRELDKYQYFTLVDKPHPTARSWNPFTKQIENPVKKELIVKVAFAVSEAAFLDWYNKYKEL